ncbi:unnamed protein product [Clonostachys rosea]|uniref:F-box domain-containing protein n=1 Tax=Bionectria ochroleuca TaxID=29856 RepID=A0ABY6U8N5_BIOOC|nr:unnamed protein product [Clonostachys rosea]
MDCDYLQDFVVPESIQFKDWADHSSKLLLFPVEILLEVFPHLDRTDAVCLALSCRRLLQVSSLAHLKVPSASHHRANKIPGCGETMKFLNRVEAPGVKWRLCMDCLHWQFKDSIDEDESLTNEGCAQAWRVFGSDCSVCDATMEEDVPMSNAE